MTTNNNYILDQLAARVEHELENDHERIAQRVVKQEIADSLEDSFGIRPDVKLVSIKKIFGLRFIEAVFEIGATTVDVKARCFRDFASNVKKVSVYGTKVRNARELSEAIESRYDIRYVNFR